MGCKHEVTALEAYNKQALQSHVDMLRGGDCLQLATAEAIDQRSITGIYTKPTNYTSVGVSVGWGGGGGGTKPY